MLHVLISYSSAYAKRRFYHCKPFLSINIKLMVFQLLVINYINYLLTFCKFEWRYSLQTLMVQKCRIIPSTWCSQENYKRTTSDVTNTKNRDNYSTTGVINTPHSERVKVGTKKLNVYLQWIVVTVPLFLTWNINGSGTCLKGMKLRGLSLYYYGSLGLG